MIYVQVSNYLCSGVKLTPLIDLCLKGLERKNERRYRLKSNHDPMKVISDVPISRN